MNTFRLIKALTLLTFGIAQGEELAPTIHQAASTGNVEAVRLSIRSGNSIIQLTLKGLLPCN